MAAVWLASQSIGLVRYWQFSFIREKKRARASEEITVHRVSCQEEGNETKAKQGGLDSVAAKTHEANMLSNELVP